MKGEVTEWRLITFVTLTLIPLNLCPYKKQNPNIWFCFPLDLKTQTLNIYWPTNTHTEVITMRTSCWSQCWKTKIHHKLTARPARHNYDWFTCSASGMLKSLWLGQCQVAKWIVKAPIIILGKNMTCQSVRGAEQKATRESLKPWNVSIKRALKI